MSSIPRVKTRRPVRCLARSGATKPDKRSGLKMFCDKCGSLMLPNGKKLKCTRCGEEKEVLNSQEFKLSDENKRKNKLLILEEKISTLPTTRAECPKCKNMNAEWWLLQTRKADEAETRFFRCTKCKFTWREYN